MIMNRIIAAPTLTVSIALTALAGAACAESLDCLIEPSSEVEVASSVEGILDELLVRPGQSVRKGDVLATLVSKVEQSGLALAEARANSTAALTSAESRYEFYRSRLERSRQLFDRRAVSGEALERAETEFIIAENDLETARQDLEIAALEVERARAVLELKTLYSPLDGVVTRHHLDPGSLVADRAIVMELATLDPLHVRAFVPVRMWPQVGKAREAKVLPQPPFDAPVDAQIIEVDSMADIASGTFGVRLALENAENRLPAGLKCTLEFNFGSDD